MTINYTNLLGLAKPVTGTETGQWGDVVNDQITELIEDAVANASSISVTSGDVTLTTTTGSSNQARMAVLLITGSPGVSRNIIAPSQSKWYIVKNSSNASIVVKGSATTGVTILADTEALVFWNGSDFEVAGLVGPSSSTDNAVARFDSTTGKVIQNSGVTIDDSNNVSGVAQLNATTADLTNLEVTNIKAKDGTAAASIADSTGVISITSNPILSGGTANGVLYLNGSKAATSGSALTFDGTNFATTGTASATKLIPTGGAATGNGMYLPAANTLAWSNNGSETMRLDSSGNLGLGVTPSTWSTSFNIRAFQLGGGSVYSYNNDRIFLGQNVAITGGGADVYLNAAAASTYRQYQGTHVWYNAPSGTVGAAISFTQAMTLDASGNLGIGTSSPGQLLTLSKATTPAMSFVRGTGTATIGVDNGGSIAVGASAGDFIIRGTGTTGNTIVASSSGVINAFFSELGNLGIGTSSPASKLNLGGVADQTIQINGSGTAAFVGTSTSVAQISSNRNPTTGAIYDAARAVSYINLEAANGNGNIQFYTTTTNNVNATERMRITAAGNLGIGTTSPVTRLDVVGAGTLTSGTAYSTVITRQDTTTNRGIFLGYDSSGQIGVIGSDSAGAGSSIAFWTYTGSVWGERARITSGGDFIVNDSSGSWSSGTARVKITQTGDNIGAWITNGSLGTTYPVLFLENYQAASSTKYLMRGDNSGGTSIRIATNGDVTNTNGSYGTISDAKMKTDIVDAGSQWEDIKAIRFRKFKMKNDPSGLLQLGVVAQELEQTSPGLVEEHADYEQVEITDEEGNVKKERQPTGTTTKSVKTSVLLMKAAVALQEAMTRIEQLEAKVAALESKGV